MTFFPMAAAERSAVRATMQANLWSGFAKQYPVDGAALHRHRRSAGLSADRSQTASADVLGFRLDHAAGRWLAALTRWIEYLSAAVLAADVMVVFVSVIYRYFLHDPVDWAEEIARALMLVLVFFGAATVLARSRHVGVDIFRHLFPARWQPALMQAAHWIVAAVSASLFVSSVLLLVDTWTQTTSIGLPQWLYVFPVVIGSCFMTLFGVANALNGPRRVVIGSFIACSVLAAAVFGWNALVPAHAVPHGVLLGLGFFGGMALGVPIGFVLAFSSLLFFLSDPSLPMLVYSQQVLAGMDHFVLLAIPFFVLAGLVMEVNGMSSRLIELLLRVFGRMRGGLNLIMITATAFFSGISGSKLADIAAVGGIMMPAVRRTKQDPNEAAGLLAATAVMAETIPPVRQHDHPGLRRQHLDRRPVRRRPGARGGDGAVAGRARGDRRQEDRPRRSVREAHADAQAARRRAGRAGHGGDDRQGRDLRRGDLDRSLGFRGDLRLRRRRAGVSRAERARARRAVRALGVDGRQHPLHRRGGVQRVVRADHRADPAARLGDDDRVRPPVRQHDVPAAVGADDDRLRRGARRRAGADHLRAAADADRAASSASIRCTSAP